MLFNKDSRLNNRDFRQKLLQTFTPYIFFTPNVIPFPYHLKHLIEPRDPRVVAIKDFKEIPIKAVLDETDKLYVIHYLQKSKYEISSYYIEKKANGDFGKIVASRYSPYKGCIGCPVYGEDVGVMDDTHPVMYPPLGQDDWGLFSWCRRVCKKSVFFMPKIEDDYRILNKKTEKPKI